MRQFASNLRKEAIVVHPSDPDTVSQERINDYPSGDSQIEIDWSAIFSNILVVAFRAGPH
jgi:hypothetical protein